MNGESAAAFAAFAAFAAPCPVASHPGLPLGRPFDGRNFGLVRFLCVSGPLKGRSFEIPEGRSTLGRGSDCALAIDDPKVSRIHAYLERRGHSVDWIDNHSTNGAFLNGERLPPDRPVALTPEDTVVFGGGEYKLVLATAPPSVRFSMVQANVTKVVRAESATANLSDTLGLFRTAPAGDADAAKAATGPKATDTPAAPDGLAISDALAAARLPKLLRSLDTLFRMSKRIAQLMPLDQLFAEMRDMLFDVFDHIENIVFLVREGDEGDYEPRLVANVNGDMALPVVIPHSVFHRALTERVTLVANDALADERFSESDSIIGLSIRSLMCVPLTLGDRTLGVLYVDNRTQGVTYEESDAEMLTVFATQAAVAIDNARLCETLQKSYHQTLQALVNTIEAKDKYTSGHSQRVARYAVAIAKEMQLPPEKIETVRTAAELHDIGKIGIKEMIMNKTGRLSDTEFGEIKGHPITGEAIIRPIAYLAPILPGIRNHHERWDGTGYPDKRKGLEIDVVARIIGVADAFDAMTTQRTYNAPRDFHQALAILRKSSGTQFDPTVVEAFARHIGATAPPGKPTPEHATRNAEADGWEADTPPREAEPPPGRGKVAEPDISS